MTVLLEGVVGSTAYGLATPDSDEDRLGVFAAPTSDVLGLGGCEVVRATRASTGPDVTHHELGKFLSLALKCNPTVMELLWLSSYTVDSDIGRELCAMRRSFLSAPLVRGAYGGYAVAQARKLWDRHREGRRGFAADLGNRTEKHGRHCMRLLLCGRHLLQTGELMVDVSAHRDHLFSMGELAVSDPARFAAEFERACAAFDDTSTVLPDSPDRARANGWLVNVRRGLL